MRVSLYVAYEGEKNSLSYRGNIFDSYSSYKYIFSLKTALGRKKSVTTLTAFSSYNVVTRSYTDSYSDFLILGIVAVNQNYSGFESVGFAGLPVNSCSNAISVSFALAATQ